MRTIPIIIALGLVSSQVLAASNNQQDCDKVAFQMGMVYSTASAERMQPMKKQTATRSARVASGN